MKVAFHWYKLRGHASQLPWISILFCILWASLFFRYELCLAEPSTSYKDLYKCYKNLNLVPAGLGEFLVRNFELRGFPLRSGVNARYNGNDGEFIITESGTLFRPNTFQSFYEPEGGPKEGKTHNRVFPFYKV